MIRACKLTVCWLLIAIATAGCWNLEEPDRLAYVMGTGLDRTPDGRLELSSLIAIPAGIGGQEFGASKESSFVLSAIGKSNAEATQNLQSRLSRNLFLGHRETILIGERMAEQGLADWVDEFFRNPQSEIRSNLLVVKGARAKDIFNLDSTYDPFITTTLNNEQETIGLRRCIFGDFMAIFLGQGLQPLVPAVRLNESNHYEYAGLAILDKYNGLRLAGYLNHSESMYAKWIDGRLTGYVMTISDSQGGTLSIKLTGMKRRIRTRMIDGGNIQATIVLSAKGIVIENNSGWKPGDAKDIAEIEAALNKQVTTAVQELGAKAQKQFRLDLFSIGNSIYKQHPYEWKAIAPEWKTIFPRIGMSVDARIKCMDQGQTDSSMMNEGGTKR